ncbi:MAG: MFS transporter [Candidatus Marinimicrobia bacterium]|nr:MFS transporter [Candidatus Neomarinimicrobiota bacterium]
MIIWITIFIDLMGITLIIPYINDFVADLGGDEQAVGFLLASYAAMQLLFAPVWGRISDRIGRRPVIIVGLAASAVAFTIFGSATQLWVLFASRMLAGIANANISTAQAYVADISTPSERAGRMGLIGAAFSLGFIVGFPIGGILSTAYGNQAPAYFAAAISLLNCLAALVILPESRSKEERRAAQLQSAPVSAWRALAVSLGNVRQFWARPELSRTLTVFFLFTTAFSVLHVTFVEYGRDILHISAQERGFVFMFIGIVGAAVQGLVVKPLAARVGEDRVIELGLLAMAIGLASIPFLRSVVELYLGAFFVALGNSLVTPAVLAVISMRSGEGEQGVAMGVTQSIGSLGRILGPPFGGLTYARINFMFPFLAAAGGALVALALYASRPRPAGSGVGSR